MSTYAIYLRNMRLGISSYCLGDHIESSPERIQTDLLRLARRYSVRGEHLVRIDPSGDAAAACEIRYGGEYRTTVLAFPIESAPTYEGRHPPGERAGAVAPDTPTYSEEW